MRISVVIASACAASLAASAGRAQDALVIKAGKALLSPERELVNPCFLIKNGRIDQVEGRPDAKAKADFEAQGKRALTFGDGAVVTAGFIDVHCTAGASSEKASAFTPELRTADDYDPFAAAWRRLRRRGVTSIVSSPPDTSLAGGQAALLKPGRPAGASNSVYIKYSLGRAALNRERRPTSLMGGLDWLREGYESLKGISASRLSPAQTAIASTLGGGRSVAITCQSPREILAALEFVKTYQLAAFLVGPTDAERCITQIAAAQTPVVLPALGFDAPAKALRLPAVLVKAGVPFAFSGESTVAAEFPHLQLSLAIAVRSGLTTKDALAAVTTVPAQLAGASDRIGTLFKGRDADLLVWSGDPWDLRSKLLLVVQSGDVVYEAE